MGVAGAAAAVAMLAGALWWPAPATAGAASLAPVTDLAGTAASETAVTLQWTDPNGGADTGVLIRRRVGATAPGSPAGGVLVADVPATATSLRVTGLTPGTEYSFAAFAHDATPSYAAPATLTTSTTPLTWGTPRVLDPPRGRPSAISCPTASFCAVVDESGRAVAVRGGRPGRPVQVDTDPDGGGLQTVSCTGPTFCMAGDRGGSMFRFDGSGWRRVLLGGAAGATTPDPAVSCAGSAFCMVVHGRVARRSAGGRWSAPRTVAGPAVLLTGVSCTGPRFCIAIGVAHPLGGTDRWIDRAYRWDGSAWSTGSRIGRYTYVRSVSCASRSFCLVTGRGGWFAEYVAGRWRAPAYSTLTGETSSVSCTAADFCLAVSSEPPLVSAARFDGAGWSRQRAILTTGFTFGAAVSCAGADSCTAVDPYGDARRWVGGWAGGPRVVDHTQGELTSVSCGSAQLCVALDQFGNYVGYHGSGWSAPRRIAARSQGALYVSCVGARFCLTVDSVGRSWVYDGSVWRAVGGRLPSGFGDVGLAACGRPGFCMALGLLGRAARFTGTGWSRPVRYDAAAGQPWSVSCTASRMCAVVASDPRGQRLFRYRSGSWRTPIALPPALRLAQASCAGTDFCLLSDDAGTVAPYRAGRIGAAVSSGAGAAVGVSCVSASFCVLDAYQSAYVWNGNSFDAAQPLTDDVFATDSAISCVRPAFCAAVGLTGAVIGR